MSDEDRPTVDHRYKNEGNIKNIQRESSPQHRPGRGKSLALYDQCPNYPYRVMQGKNEGKAKITGDEADVGSTSEEENGGDEERKGHDKHVEEDSSVNEYSQARGIGPNQEDKGDIALSTDEPTDLGEPEVSGEALANPREPFIPNIPMDEVSPFGVTFPMPGGLELTSDQISSIMQSLQVEALAGNFGIPLAPNLFPHSGSPSSFFENTLNSLSSLNGTGFMDESGAQGTELKDTPKSTSTSIPMMEKGLGEEAGRMMGGTGALKGLTDPESKSPLSVKPTSCTPPPPPFPSLEGTEREDIPRIENTSEEEMEGERLERILLAKLDALSRERERQMEEMHRREEEERKRLREEEERQKLLREERLRRDEEHRRNEELIRQEIMNMFKSRRLKSLEGRGRKKTRLEERMDGTPGPVSSMGSPQGIGSLRGYLSTPPLMKEVKIMGKDGEGEKHEEHGEEGRREEEEEKMETKKEKEKKGRNGIPYEMDDENSVLEREKDKDSFKGEDNGVTVGTPPLPKERTSKAIGVPVIKFLPQDTSGGRLRQEEEEVLTKQSTCIEARKIPSIKQELEGGMVAPAGRPPRTRPPGCRAPYHSSPTNPVVQMARIKSTSSSSSNVSPLSLGRKEEGRGRSWSESPRKRLRGGDHTTTMAKFQSIPLGLSMGNASPIRTQSLLRQRNNPEKYTGDYFLFGTNRSNPPKKDEDERDGNEGGEGGGIGGQRQRGMFGWEK